MLNRALIILSMILWGLAPGWAAERITTVAGARVRAAATGDAPLVAVLPFGTVMAELARGDTPQTIGGSEDYWYRVGLPDGGEGWIFGTLTRPFDTGQAASIYQELAEQRLASQLSFADQVDLTHFLARVKEEVLDPEAAGTLALAHLRSVRRSLDIINVVAFEARQTSDYQQWLVELDHQGLLAYSEPAAEYLIPLARIWDLHDEFYPLAVAEAMAWLAVTNPWVGECEGYLSCVLGVIQRTSGRYLKYHPGGVHAEDALANIASFLEPSPALEAPTDERALINRQIAVLLATVARTAEPGDVPAQLEALRQRYVAP